MSKGAIIGIVIAIAVIVFVLWIWLGYNSLINNQANVEKAWSQVENQFQRRADLIPNLVETVKGIVGQEQTVFTEVTKLRSQWADAGTRDEKIDAASGLDGAISRLLLVAENYPDLKSNQNFIALQDELAGTENRVATERKRYNDAVTVYNKSIRFFPGSVLASWFGFGEEQLFEAEEGADVAPDVEFDLLPEEQ
ncbi:LemA family protein [Patescibacteria group bacterium]